MPRVLYVYAFGEALRLDPLQGLEGVDGGASFQLTGARGMQAIFSDVDADSFSQDEIDRRAGDLEWIGGIVVRHEAVVAALARAGAIIPLRAFTLFSSSEALEEFLGANAASLVRTLGALGGREEWTIRLEFDPEQWSRAIVQRVDSLRRLSDEINATSEGKAFLLRKKLDDEKRKAAREAEQSVVTGIEDALRSTFPDAPLLVETRQQKAGSFPQLNLLIDPSDAERLRQACDEQQRRHQEEGVRLTLTGPWPPYSFASSGT